METPRELFRAQGFPDLETFLVEWKLLFSACLAVSV